MQAFDAARNRTFPCDVWRPKEPVGTCPIILLSHSSGGSGRRGYTFLTNHLASHGYIVAGLNHSELVALELGHRDGETPEQRTARAEATIASRVPDIRFLLDYLLTEAQLKLAPVGIVGHSFGGWTALASPDVVHEIRAVVALAPAGSSNPRPGILRSWRLSGAATFRRSFSRRTTTSAFRSTVCTRFSKEYLPRNT